MFLFRMLMGSGLGMALLKDGNPFGLHYVMFLPALLSQGSPEQILEWVPKAWAAQIVGTYAQVRVRLVDTGLTFQNK